MTAKKVEFKQLGIYGNKTVEDIQKSGELIRAQIAGDCPKRSPVTGVSVPLVERRIDYATGIRRLNSLRKSAYDRYNGKSATPAHIRDAFDDTMRGIQDIRPYGAPRDDAVCPIHGTPSANGCSVCEVEQTTGNLPEMFEAKGYDKKFLAEYFGAEKVTMSLKDIQTAKELGRVAFGKGITGPENDPELQSLLAGKEEGEREPIIHSWTRSWKLERMKSIKFDAPYEEEGTSPSPDITFKPGVSMGKVSKTRKGVPRKIRDAVRRYAVEVSGLRWRSRSMKMTDDNVLADLKKSHRSADNALADLIEYSEGKRTLSDDEIQEVLDSQVYEWDFGEYTTMAKLRKSEEQEVLAFADLLDALGYAMAGGDVVKTVPTPSSDPTAVPLSAPTNEWFGAEGEGEEVPSEETQLSPEEAKAEKESMKEEATFVKIAGEEVKKQRKELHRFAKTYVGSNIMRRIEEEALKLVPGKYPGSHRYELKVTAQMLEWTEGRTEWDWSYVMTEDLGPAKLIPRTDPTTGEEVLDEKGNIKMKVHYPGKCALCNAPIRYRWVFEQKDPATGKMVGVGIVCSHTQLGVPQDILARAYALVTKLAGIARRKTANSELTVEFGPWLDSIATLDKHALVTFTNDTVENILKKYVESGDITHMLRNIKLWLEHDRSTTLRLTKDMLESLRKLKDDPDFSVRLKVKVLEAEERKREEDEAREFRWKAREATMMGIDPTKYRTLAELREAIKQKEDEQARERLERSRQIWVDRALDRGIDPDKFPELDALVEAVVAAENAREESGKVAVQKFLETYGKTNDYLDKLRAVVVAGGYLSRGQKDAVDEIKKRFEEELSVHPEFGYALANADTDTDMRDLVKKISFAYTLSDKDLARVKASMSPLPVTPAVPATGTPVAVPKPPSWKDDEWESLQWFNENEDAIRTKYPKNWIFKHDHKYGRTFIDSVRYFAKTDRSMSDRMSGIFRENVAKLKERLGGA